MDFPPEYAEQQQFIFGLLDAAPELKPAWEDYAADEYEFIPTTAMYDLARGIVKLVHEQMDSPTPARDDALQRIFSVLEGGMAYSEDGPIPNLIRLTICDWLGRQSEFKPVYTMLLTYMGPSIRQFIVTADDLMPFRDGDEGPLSKDKPKPPINRSPAELPLLDVADGESLEIVLSEAWRFTFYRCGGRYLLSVVCGGAGLYDVAFELSAEEMEAFERKGPESIVALVNTVNTDSSAYLDRRVRIPQEMQMEAIENRSLS